MRIENGVLLQVTKEDIISGGFNFPEGITSIGGQVFRGCSSLTQITLPERITFIGNWAFSNCSGLIQITLPDGITSISDGTFGGCRSLTQITLPDSITSIGRGALTSCSSLTDIYVIAKTAKEFERVRLLLPENTQSKAKDIMQGHLDVLQLFLATPEPMNENKEEREQEQRQLQKVNESIAQLQSMIDRYPSIKERQSELNSLIIKIHLKQNDLPSAIDYFRANPNPKVSDDTAVAVMSALFISEENRTELIALFKEYYQVPDVYTLLEKSALGVLDSLTNQTAGLDRTLEFYHIDQCVPCSTVEVYIETVMETLHDEPLKRQQLTEIKDNLQRLTLHETHQLFSIPLFKELKQGKATIVMFESLINLNNAEDITAYAPNEEQNTEEETLRKLAEVINKKKSALHTNEHSASLGSNAFTMFTAVKEAVSPENSSANSSDNSSVRP